MNFVKTKVRNASFFYSFFKKQKKIFQNINQTLGKIVFLNSYRNLGGASFNLIKSLSLSNNYFQGVNFYQGAF